MRMTIAAIGPALVLGLSAALEKPAEAGAGFTIQFGSGPDVTARPPATAPGAQPRASTPWVTRRQEPRDKPHHGHDRDWDRGDRHDRWHRYRSPYLGHYGGTYYAAPEPPEPKDPPVAAAPPEPAPAPGPPPDPRGPLFLSPARGAAAESETWQVGDTLPPSVPQVTLDWRSYDLPEPPAGRIYARVGRAVLLITASDRVIEDVLPPG